MVWTASIPLIVAVSITAIAAWIDLRTGHIPNWVTLGPLAAAPILHFAINAYSNPLAVAVQAGGFSVLGALVCAAVPLALFRAGAMGGGDVKLLAAVGALCRPTLGIEAELYAFVAAALFVPARLAWDGRLMRVLGNTVTLVANPLLPKERRRTLSPEMLTSVRFGPAILAGTVLAVGLRWGLP